MAGKKSNLQDKFSQIQEKLKDVPGVYVHDIRNFVDGNVSVSKKGILKLPLSLPAQDVLPVPNDVGSVLRGEWKLLPILMFVETDK